MYMYINKAALRMMSSPYESINKLRWLAYSLINILNMNVMLKKDSLNSNPHNTCLLCCLGN